MRLFPWACLSVESYLGVQEEFACGFLKDEGVETYSAKEEVHNSCNHRDGEYQQSQRECLFEDLKYEIESEKSCEQD